MSAGESPYPRVVACIPAYNSARFISNTLRSLADQTYPNLQILISDDASSDDTVGVCLEFAGNDRRFVVLRQTSNLGWIGNTNVLLQSADGDYLFRAGHDDIYEPDFVARLVQQLELNAAAVLAFSDQKLVTAGSPHQIQTFGCVHKGDDRMDRALAIAERRSGWWVAGSGIVRMSAIRRAGRLERHLKGELGADWPWLIRLALEGEFIRVPQVLFTKVITSQSVSRSWTRDRWAYASVALSSALQLNHAGLSARDRLRVQRQIGKFCLDAMTSTSWSKRRISVAKSIAKHVPTGEAFILVDEDKLELDTVPNRKRVPFPEREGNYWGPPADDDAAIESLERKCGEGVRYVAFCWPAFWWLEYYSGFRDHLASRCHRLFADDHIVIYRLRHG